MSGGFIGIEKVLSDQDEMEIKTRLEAALKEELLSEARAQVPEEFVLLAALSSITFENLPQTSSADKNSVTVNMRGHLSGIMFKKNNLSTHLARKKIQLASEESVDIASLDSLTFVFADSASANLASSDEIKFSVKGQSTALWPTDEVALKTDLIGRHKRDISSILNNYPNIISAKATIRPFWKSSFPENSARISIKKLPVN